MRYVELFAGAGGMINRSPCLVAGCTQGPCENAHTKGEGMGRKGHYTTVVPLCPGHHHESHTAGVVTFAARYGLDLAAEARRIATMWEARCED